MLSTKHEIFCSEYIKHKNATKAYQVAYPKVDRRTAKVNGARLLTNANLKARIDQLLAELLDRNKLTADDIIQELRSLAFWSINDFVSEGNKIKDISKLKRSLNRPVIGIKTKTETRTIGDIEFSETTTELKFVDKRAALVDLGRHLGIFKEDNEQKTIKIKVSRK